MGELLYKIKHFQQCREVAGRMFDRLFAVHLVGIMVNWQLESGLTAASALHMFRI
jgi:hypothetical protein